MSMDLGARGLVSNLRKDTTRAARLAKITKAFAHDRPLRSRPWIAPTNWTQGQAVNAGEVRVGASSHWYVAVSTGTCGASQPSHVTGAAVSDGTVLWTYIGDAIGDSASDPLAPTWVDTGSASTPGGTTKLDMWANRGLVTLFGGTGIVQGAGNNRIRIQNFQTQSGTWSYGKSCAAFWSDAALIAFEGPSTNPGICIHADGRPIKMGAMLANFGGNYMSTCTWPSRKQRLYELFFSKLEAIVPVVAIPSTDQIWPLRDPAGIRMAIIADSYDDDSSYHPFLPGNSLGTGIGRRLGIRDVWHFSKGGTGLIAKGSGSAFYTYLERLPQVLASNPDLIVIYGSTNDQGQTQGAVQAAATALLNAIRAATDVPVIWHGPAPISLTWSSIGPVDAGIAAAVAARSGEDTAYVSLYTATPPWITGNWNNGSYSWSSNASQYIGGDSTHPVDIGVMYLADRMAEEIRRILLAMAALDLPAIIS